MHVVDAAYEMLLATQGSTRHFPHLASRLADADAEPIYDYSSWVYEEARRLIGINRRRSDCKTPVAATAMLFHAGRLIAVATGYNHCREKPGFKGLWHSCRG